MTYVLRKYQEEAVSKIVSFYGNTGLFKPRYIVLPTGSGKTLVISEATKRLNVHTLILCNNMELVKQDVEKLGHFVDKSEIGIYSASLNQKNIRRFTVGTIQSIHKNLSHFAHFQLIIVDECDLFVRENKMFHRIALLSERIHSKIVGLTATPYRMVVEKEYDFQNRKIYLSSTVKILHDFEPWGGCLYCVNQKELVDAGFLCPISIPRQHEMVDLEFVKTSGNDYNMKDYEWRFSRHEETALKIISAEAKSRAGVIVFCTSIKQAERLSTAFNSLNHSTDLFSKPVCSAAIYSGLGKKEREVAVDGFKNGTITVLFNVNILTRGFDYEKLDCAILLRPTKSLSLYTQMLGRIARTYPGKKEAFLIDLAGSSKMFGRPEEIFFEEDDIIIKKGDKSTNLVGEVLGSYQIDY